MKRTCLVSFTSDSPFSETYVKASFGFGKGLSENNQNACLQYIFYLSANKKKFVDAFVRQVGFCAVRTCRRNGTMFRYGVRAEVVGVDADRGFLTRSR